MSIMSHYGVKVKKSSEWLIWYGANYNLLVVWLKTKLFIYGLKFNTLSTWDLTEI